MTAYIQPVLMPQFGATATYYSHGLLCFKCVLIAKYSRTRSGNNTNTHTHQQASAARLLLAISRNTNMEDDDTPRDWNDIAGQEILGEDTSTSNTQDSESCASDDTNEPGHKFNFRMEKQLRSQRYHGSGRGPWGGDYKAHIKQGSWRGGVFEWEGWKADQERNRRTRQHDDGDSLSRRYLEELKRSGLTYYQVLGVSDNATIQDLRRAYRKMAFLYHPDRNMGDMAAEQRFRDIQKAFQTLSDPFRRAMYNETIKFTSISNQNQPQYQTNNSRDAATKTAGHLNPDEREPFPSI